MNEKNKSRPPRRAVHFTIQIKTLASVQKQNIYIAYYIFTIYILRGCSPTYIYLRSLYLDLFRYWTTTYTSNSYIICSTRECMVILHCRDLNVRARAIRQSDVNYLICDTVFKVFPLYIYMYIVHIFCMYIIIYYEWIWIYFYVQNIRTQSSSS